MRLLAFFVLASALSGCGPPIDQAADIKPDGMPSYDAFVGATQFPYVASMDRREQLLTGLAKATPCLSKPSVEALLGKPDYSRLACPKEPDRKCKGTTWMYFLRANSATSTGSDPVLEVFFNAQDRATWFVTEHVQGTHEVGGLGERCT